MWQVCKKNVRILKQSKNQSSNDAEQRSHRKLESRGNAVVGSKDACSSSALAVWPRRYHPFLSHEMITPRYLREVTVSRSSSKRISRPDDPEFQRTVLVCTWPD